MNVRAAVLMLLGIGCADSLALAGPEGADQPRRIALGELQPGDSLQVRVEWFGCFMHSIGDLGFAVLPDGRMGASGRVRHETSGTTTMAGPEGEWPVSLQIPAQFLTLNERADLDQWLAYHRAASDQMCSNGTVFTLELVRGGSVVQREMIESQRCGYLPGLEPPPYSFDRLIASAGEPQLRERAR